MLIKSFLYFNVQTDILDTETTWCIMKGKSAQRVRRASIIVRNALLVNEAAVHMKNGNYNKAILLYNQVSFTTMHFDITIARYSNDLSCSNTDLLRRKHKLTTTYIIFNCIHTCDTRADNATV